MTSAAEVPPEVDWSTLDYTAVIEERTRCLDALRADSELLAATKVYYRTHVHDFIDDWLWTYDPRLLPKLAHVPLIMWPRQREYISWLEERFVTRTPGLCEKSRDMGVSYLSLAFALWLWLFHPGSKCAFGSRKEDLVDKIGDPDSLFEKLRMMLRMLPEELLPAGFSEDADVSFLKFINRENGATITGEAGDNIGRGGRNTIYFVDEAAFIPRAARVDAALSQNTKIRIDVSSANGTGNSFYKKKMAAVVAQFRLHWRSDPRKDDAWYDEQQRTLDPWIVASEIDIDYNASVEGVCIPGTYVQACIGLDRNEKLPEDFRKALSLGMRRAGLDVADEGGDLNVYAEVTGVKVTHLESWKEGTTTETARRANDLARQRKAAPLRSDRPGVGAGVKGEFKELKKRGVAVEFELVNTGDPPPPGRCDESDVPNSKRYKNLRAFLWWGMRRRCIRTYEHVHGIKQYEPDQLLALPTIAECPKVMELAAELSRPKALFNDAGLILIESKEKMEGPSTNLADAFLMNWIKKRVFNPLHHIR